MHVLFADINQSQHNQPTLITTLEKSLPWQLNGFRENFGPKKIFLGLRLL